MRMLLCLMLLFTSVPVLAASTSKCTLKTVIKITKEENLNINATIEGEVVGDLKPDEAASVLSVLAAAKRRKDRGKE